MANADAVLDAIHKCPRCGVAVPNLRTELTGHLTCIKCTKFQTIIVGSRSKFGGGNEKVYHKTIEA